MKLVTTDSDLSPLPLCPTLLIGIGPWGAEVLDHFQKALAERLGGPLELPVVGLLALQEQEQPRAGVTSFALDPRQAAERLRELSVPGQTPHYRWWYPGWSAWLEAAADLSASRPLGRMAFFQNYPTLRGCLQERLVALRDPQNASQLLTSPTLREMRRVAQVRFDQPTRVHVIGSAAGSLAGVWIDLGFLLRECAPEGGMVRSAWVALSDDQGALASSYATLKELNHYLQDGHGFGVEWEPGRPLRPAWPAYEECYLQNVGEARQIAEHLAREVLVSEYAEAQRSLRRSHSAGPSAPAPGRALRLRQRLAGNFSRLGIGRVRISHRALQRSGAYRLAAAALEVLAETETGPGDFLALEDESSTHTAWLEDLTGAARDGLWRQLEDWGRASTGSLLRGQHEQLERVLQQGRRWLEQELLPPLELARERLLQREVERLRQATLTFLTQQGSLAMALRAFGECRQRLQRWGENCRRQISALVDRQIELSAQAARLSADLLRVRQGRNWDGRRDLLVSHYTRKVMELQLGSRANPGLMLARLLQAALQQIQGLCRDLSDHLEARGSLGAELALLLQRARDTRENLLERAFPPGQPGEDGYDLCSPQRFLDEIYPRYVGADLPERLVRAWLASQPGGVLEALAQEEALETLLERCRPIFGRLPQDYALPRHLDELRQLLPRLLEESQARLPASDYMLYAFPTTAAGSTPLERSQSEHQLEELLQLVRRQLRRPLTTLALNDSEELVVAGAAVALPIHRLLPLTAYREAYLSEFLRGQALHIEAQDDRFCDLEPPTSQETAQWEEASEILDLGRLLELVEEHDGEFYWKAERAVHPLGEPHRALLKLTRAPRLRAQLGAQARRLLEQRLEGSEAAPLLSLARCLTRAKQRLWERREEAGLEYLRQLERRIQASQVYRDNPAPFLKPDPEGETGLPAGESAGLRPMNL